MKILNVTVPCGSNTVRNGKWLKQDGSGAYAENAAATGGKGVAFADKDAQNNCSMVKIGLMTLTAKAAAYKHGDALELDSTGQALQAVTSNPVVAYAQETVTLSSDGDLDVLVHAL